MRTGGRSSVERCSPSVGVDLDVGNAVGTASVAQPQRGIEWPAAGAWASLNRSILSGPRRATALRGSMQGVLLVARGHP